MPQVTKLDGLEGEASPSFFNILINNPIAN
jgi:hypothetical protein